MIEGGYLKRGVFPILLVAITLQMHAQFNVIITGKVKNYNNEWKIEDMSETASLSLPNNERSFLPDSFGLFTVKFRIMEPNYYRIGRNIIYVSPGDSIFTTIDFEKPEAAVFQGSHAEANTYLIHTPFPMAGSFLAEDNIIKQTVDQTISEILRSADLRKNKLHSFNNLSADFVFLEEARIKADIINSLNDIHYEFSAVHKIPKDSLALFKVAVEKKIEPYIQDLSLGFTDPFFLKLTVYQRIVRRVIEVNQGRCSPKNIKVLSEWIHARDLFNEMRQTTDKSKLEGFKKDIFKISYSSYRIILTQSVNTLLDYGNGDTATNFAALDNFGKVAKLNKYVGKIICIDVWATWCGPCIAAMPEFELLKFKYQDNPNVVFISLSIDEDHDKWRQKIGELSLTSHRWITDRANLGTYLITGVPRSILIDEKFTIASFSGPSVDDTKPLTKLIDILIAQQKQSVQKSGK